MERCRLRGQARGDEQRVLLTFEAALRHHLVVLELRRLDLRLGSVLVRVETEPGRVHAHGLDRAAHRVGARGVHLREHRRGARLGSAAGTRRDWRRLHGESGRRGQRRALTCAGARCGRGTGRASAHHSPGNDPNRHSSRRDFGREQPPAGMSIKMKAVQLLQRWDRRLGSSRSRLHHQLP
jgi:hypothetical protein